VLFTKVDSIGTPHLTLRNLILAPAPDQPSILNIVKEKDFVAKSFSSGTDLSEGYFKLNSGVFLLATPDQTRSGDQILDFSFPT
jgi:hypothetical protein